MSTNNMDRFEFRCIRPEETQQAIEIEQICFPPNEACSPKSLTERIKATAETFLVAEDKETGKLAAFLNGVPTDEEAFRDEFFTEDRKSTRLNSSHANISYAVFCLK